MDEDQGFDEDEDMDVEDRETPAADVNEMSGPQEKLWVEKYTPRRYTDLLSEEVRFHASTTSSLGLYL